MSSQVSAMVLNDFAKYFEGNKNKYGYHVYDKEEKIVEGKKEKGKGSFWKKDQFKNFVKPTRDTYLKHLEGINPMGVCPINENNNVSFAVIDFDSYDKEVIKKKVKYIYSNNFPLLCFRSKSGGLHLYMFFKEPVQAKRARQAMKRLLPLLDLPPNTEVFPKQDRLKGEDSGSWINLPYFKCYEPKSYLFGNDCEEIPINEALGLIKSKLKTLEDVEDFFDRLDYSDAPPCLQALALLGGVTEQRNIYLFNMGVYINSKFGNGDEFIAQILKANEELDIPLPTGEVLSTIVSSFKKDSTSYSYKCKEEPLCSYCNKKECGLREYGLGKGFVSELDYEELIQHKTEDTAYYEWKINGVMLSFKDEADIIQQKKFREQCFQKLHILPMQLKNETWTKIVNTSLSSIKVIEVDNSSDFSAPSMLIGYLKEFILRGTLAVNPSQVMIGKVWLSEKDNVYYFKKEALAKFLFDNKKFTMLSRADISRKINQLCEGHHIAKVIGVGNKKTTRVTGIPKDFITDEDRLNITDKQLEVDFTKHNERPF